MKTRLGFVSNSSSSSFLIDKKLHGSWFTQALNIVKAIPDRAIDRIAITFDDRIDPQTLMFGLQYVKEVDILAEKESRFWFLGAQRFADALDSYNAYILTSSHASFLHHLDASLTNHILKIYVMLEDDQFIGSTLPHSIYQKLKATGLEFEWSR